MLTRRQQVIYEFIREFRARHGVAPTLDEIRRHLGVGSLATVHKHLESMERRGAIRRGQGARALDVVSETLPAQVGGAIAVPLLGTVAAGHPIEAVEAPETVLIPETLSAGPDTFVLRVRGESMIDEQIRSGDLIVLRPASTAENGQMVVALIDHEDVTLKRFYREHGGMVRLQPANPAFEPILLPADRVGIQGVVVGVIRRY